MTRNVIQKAILDLHYTGSTDGFAMQREIGDWCNEELGRGLEEILDKADTSATVKKIDRIELEINMGSAKDWLSQLSKEITTQLSKKLNELMPEADSGVQELTLEHHFFEVFIYFLQHGYLPWWSSIRNRQEFSTNLLAALQNGITGDMKSHLLEIVSESITQERLIDQLNDNEWVQFISEFYTGQRNEIQALFKDISTLLTIVPELKRKKTKAKFKAWLWEHAGDDSPKKALQEVALNIAKEVYIVSEEDGKAAFKMIQSVSLIMDEAIKKVEKNAEISQPGSTVNKNADKLKEINKKKNKDRQDHKEAEKILSEGIYINNAGLVIVSPFIPPFLKKLNLANNDEILDKETAINLVAYLATGTEYGAEFDLVFPKILCGIDPGEQISSMVSLTDEQKQEARDVLLSAIEYWNVLRDTSPEGLRESFLQREGKLSFKEKEWILQVEQKPFDMLLQNLPWNINMIKLPWMKSMLKTEWSY